MARMDIEDQFWLDLMGVIEKMGDQDKAAGNALRFLRFSQEQHRKGKLLSEDEFKAKGFHESLFGLFAERVEGGIQAIGASKHFGWLDKKAEAGRKGGRSKSEAKTKHLKQNVDKSSEAKPKQKVAKGGITEPTPTLSHSLSNSSSSTGENPSDSKPQAFIAGYCRRFKEKHGDNPEILGKDAGIASRVVKGWSLSKIDLYLDAFFAMPDAWLEKTKHPIAAFETKLNEIVVFAKSGQFTTLRQAQQGDSAVAVSSQLQRIREGKL